MKTIVFIQNTLLHYRKAFYNALAVKYDVIVIHSDSTTVENSDKYVEIITPVTKVGPFYFQNNFTKIIEEINPDYVIAMFDIRWLNTFRLLKKQAGYKFIWWGLDTGNNQLATKAKVMIARLGYPIVFYNTYNMDKMSQFNLGVSQLFVANNTFDVGVRNKSYRHPQKNKILFVGSFDYRKRNDVLVTAFSKIVDQFPKDIELVFIGDGIEKHNTEQLVDTLGLAERIKFVGRVNEPSELATFYKEAIFCVSFGQAGLSVLQSLGFGVPYITKVNAISGGEISNIIHGKNGYFCDDSVSSLEHYMLKLVLDIDLARSLGQGAFEYYSNNCTVENMVNGFEKALTTC
jgi:glycosyltransferase involved in cell wall biosynthesis